MNKQQTITIAGVEYDAHTGIRIAASESKTTDAAHHTKSQPTVSHALHVRHQKSTTLRRSHVSAPVRKTPIRMHSSAVHKSPMIRKFAAMDMVAPSQKKQPMSPQAKPDIAPVRHPIQDSVSQRQAVPVVTQKPARVIKDEAIADALSKAVPAKPIRQSFLRRHPRVFSVTSAALVVVFLAGYLTYVNLPGISVRVAAAQAGINATLPSYHPSGYRLDGPVAFTNGTVTMDFAANASSNKFTLTQSKSSWDSLSLQQNLVTKVAGDEYDSYSNKGLTLYIYGNDASWVNGGILHTINSTATLSNDQLTRIATSM